ncbi:quaternary ammonium compound efflux SMR transporter SugE [Rhodopirellula sp. JC740]|uniref:Guanidinium exporter n=1 Tax=Rhodopirellula halodulae TaxID=2894198 RepID=A0ABS8NGX4_9BACT|nr:MULTISPECIES: quaternary ammonium compound efflux SMR transporter SugE [unclassified Rhodopirellula]MCC9642795.1 quaternary ammonium compound efflux SMR transporter SugE [Rhodopirellula sp. JC740]MCC9656168.1 quaternary ammonium compound efflux SMR transporter SugE [Rhodopirellula sp. JC737]
MAWLFLLVAGLLEIGWAVGLKYTEGFSRPVPTLITVVIMIASFFTLSLALREIPLGTGYAVWTGIGAVGTAIAGIVLFNEPKDVVRLLCIGLIVAGIVGLKLASPHTGDNASTTVDQTTSRP